MTSAEEATFRTCFDSCDPLGHGSQSLVLKGWLIAPFLIRAIGFRWPDGSFAAGMCGVSRPDLTAAFPAEPHALHGGFWSAHPRFANLDEAELIVSDLSGSWWRAPSPQTMAAVHQLVATRANATESGAWQADFSDAWTALADEFSVVWRRGLEENQSVTLRLDIINKCNLRCVMCHYSDDAIFRRPAKRVSLEDFDRWFATVDKAVREVVLSCGDEPLMSPQFSEIVRAITSRRPEINVMFSTNAMLMDERIARTIVDSGVALVMMSIDGVRPQTLEAVRQGSRFDRVIGNAHRLAELKRRVGSLRPHLVYNFVMMNRNLAEAPAFVELARALGANYIDFRHVVTSDYFSDAAQLCENEPGRFNFFRRLTLEAAKDAGLPIYIPPAFPAEEEPEEVPDLAELLAPFYRFLGEITAKPANVGGLEPKPAMTEFGPRLGTLPPVFCERPFSEIMIRNQEEVLPCAWHRNVLGNLSSGATVGEVFFGPRFDAVRANMLRPEGDPGCVGCPIKSSHLPTTRHG